MIKSGTDQRSFRKLLEDPQRSCKVIGVDRIRVVIEARDELTLRGLDQLVSSTTRTNLLFAVKNANTRKRVANCVRTRDLVGIDMHQNFIRCGNATLDHTERCECLL